MVNLWSMIFAYDRGSGPIATVRKRIHGNRISMDLGRIPGPFGRDVGSFAYDAWIGEVLVQVVHVFGYSALQFSGNGHVIEASRDVLHHLAQSDPARMRTDRDTEFGGQQQNGVVTRATSPILYVS